MHPNPELGALRKVKWEKIENLGPPLRTYPILDSGPLEGPEGYRMHPNPELGALRKVKWEKIENFPPKRRFSPKIDGLL